MLNNKKTKPILRIILIIWLVFSSLYVIHNEYLRLNQFVYNKGMTEGFRQAVTELLKKSQSCEPVPIFLEDQTEKLVNLKCLQPSEEAAQSTEDKTISNDQFSNSP